MRYTLPVHTQQRTICTFLFWPKAIGRSWRWLEWAYIAQEYDANRSKWINARFMEGPERITNYKDDM